VIFYLVKAAHRYTMATYVRGWTSQTGGRLQFLPYELLPGLKELPAATYLFTDLERLTPAQLELTRELWRQLAGAGDAVRLLNDPQRVLGRYELLRTLHERGQNRFRAPRASDDLGSLRFPVFVRREDEHTGSLSPLLDAPAQVEPVLRSLCRRGHRRERLLVVEFCDTSDAEGLYRKYSAFAVGGEILPRHLLFGREWVLRSPETARPDLAREELDYLEGNPHAGALRGIFQLAGVDYGRIDYALLDGEPQVWEINTNPTVRRLTERLSDAFERIDTPERPGSSIPLAFDPELLQRVRGETRGWHPTRVRETMLGVLRSFRIHGLRGVAWSHRNS
jgi:hypothetical protein